MHYLKQRRVMFPVALEEPEVVYMFFATFFFSLSLSFGKWSNLAKIWGELQHSQPPGFYGPALIYILQVNLFRHLACNLPICDTRTLVTLFQLTQQNSLEASQVSEKYFLGQCSHPILGGDQKMDMKNARLFI